LSETQCRIFTFVVLLTMYAAKLKSRSQGTDVAATHQIYFTKLSYWYD